MSDEVLVTGAAGFVGRHLTRRLAREGHHVVAADVEPEPPLWYAEHVGDGVDYRIGDVTDESFLDDLTDRRYDRVFHLAAVVGVSDYVENTLELMEVNVIGTKRLLERFRGSDARFVFTSTSEVYGKNPAVPWAEGDDRVLGPPTINRWSYSTSKSACEHMLHALSRSGALETTIVRPFNLYGPGQRLDFVVPAFLHAVADGDVPRVYDDGTQTRCFTYVGDFVDGAIAASTAPAAANEVFNLGATREVQIRELAELALQVAGKEETSPQFVDTDELYGEEYEDLDRRVPDVAQARDQLGWTAETPLEEGLERTLARIRDRKRVGES